MKRLLLILLALCIAAPCYAEGNIILIKKKAAAGGGNTFAILQSGSSAQGNAPHTIQLTNVQTGSLLVAWAEWWYYDTAPSISDGTTTFTAGTRGSVDAGGAYYYGQFFYLPSSVASGTVTYTLTVSGDPSGTAFRIYEVSHTSSVSLDVQNIGGGQSTAPVSGSVNTTTGGITFGGVMSLSGPTFSSPLIAGVAADGAIGGGADQYSMMSYKMLSSSTSGVTAAFTFSASNYWVCNVISFK